MKKNILMCFSLFFIAIFLLNSCGIGERMEKILRTDNSNWEAEEIDLSFSFFQEKKEYNASMRYKNRDYFAFAYVDYNYVHLYFWFYDLDNNNEIGAITFESDRVIDNNTFTLTVIKTDFDIPQRITFHRVEQN